jgi:hypothetical protein
MEGGEPGIGSILYFDHDFSNIARDFSESFTRILVVKHWVLEYQFELRNIDITDKLKQLGLNVSCSVAIQALS